jgi:hypothetical protein
MPKLEPGWADHFDVATQGGTDVEQRIRARGGKPFRVCADDVVAKAKRGAARGAATKHKRDLDEVLGPVDAEDEA